MQSEGKDKKGKRKCLQVQFNLQLGEVIETDIQYLKAFTDYFISDANFGADMSATKERERASSIQKEDLRK
eukprot:gene15005-4466_t